ncbi:MAG: riboflavin synthase [Chitinophagales bacterium]|nr:riboflavin synthase [Bacteroidota bacterium]MBP7398848.1 riboflavin synthase [Chitinophagales bacterium]MBP8754768.1 riboflavin synthase [Chitinophagales bacterium]MBP9189330.1 riboflavin synthase [Chitinophagales bacterium]MBP9549359.1 riboflavin synthase [Chitinophagales bacterium]
MFTGIIEANGIVTDLNKEGNNLHITIQSSISTTFKIDQSVSHNGVCLTVVKVTDTTYVVTAIEETLIKSNLSFLQIGSNINLERSMQLGERLDGHIVQGHVDTTAILKNSISQQGSWILTFEMDIAFRNFIVEKGSITLNGVSLTLLNVGETNFSVAIIPYTWEHTNLSQIKIGESVNVEFDILAKYFVRMFGNYNNLN